MYSNDLSMAKPMQKEDPKKQDAIKHFVGRLIEDFPAYEAAEVLQTVIAEIKQYHSKQLEDAKMKVERMIKETEPLANL